MASLFPFCKHRSSSSHTIRLHTHDASLVGFGNFYMNDTIIIRGLNDATLKDFSINLSRSNGKYSKKTIIIDSPATHFNEMLGLLENMNMRGLQIKNKVLRATEINKLSATLRRINVESFSMVDCNFAKSDLVTQDVVNNFFESIRDSSATSLDINVQRDINFARIISPKIKKFHLYYNASMGMIESKIADFITEFHITHLCITARTLEASGAYLYPLLKAIVNSSNKIKHLYISAANFENMEEFEFLFTCAVETLIIVSRRPAYVSARPVDKRRVIELLENNHSLRKLKTSWHDSGMPYGLEATHYNADDHQIANILERNQQIKINKRFLTTKCAAIE